MVMRLPTVYMWVVMERHKQMADWDFGWDAVNNPKEAKVETSEAAQTDAWEGVTGTAQTDMMHSKKGADWL